MRACPTGIVDWNVSRTTSGFRTLAVLSIVALISLQCSEHQRGDSSESGDVPHFQTIYPDFDPEADATGLYYSLDRLNRSLNGTHTQEEILRIHGIVTEFDAWLSTRFSYYGINTVTVAIVNNRSVIYQRAINANLRKQYPVVSFTKPITAIGVMRLAESGAVSLDDDVNQHLPGAIRTYPFSEPVTIRHLLTHTSGLAESPDRLNAPGERFMYSNYGYKVLGQVLARVSQKNLIRVFREDIFTALQFQSSTPGADLTGAHGLWTSTADLRKVLMMELNRGRLGEDQILNDTSYRAQFYTPTATPDCQFVEYRGIAWRVWSADGEPLLLNHAALWFGAGGTIQFFPKHNIGYVYISNPTSHEEPRFQAFYNTMRERLNDVSVRIANIEHNPNDIRPCAFHAVPW